MTNLSITFTIDDQAQVGRVIQALGGGASTTTGGTTTGGTTSTNGGATTGGTTTTPPPPPAAVDYFPASPADAPAPSPEGSKIISLNGVVSGKPYLVDKNGGIWQMGNVGTTGPVGGGTPSNIILFNGTPNGFQGDSMQIIQGEMWWHYQGYYYKFVLPAGYGGKTTNPPPYVPGFGQQYVAPSASSPGSLPGMPALPPLASPAPGSTTAVTQATGTLAAALASASAGGTVALTPGTTYKESVGITLPLKLTGGGTVANSGTATAAFSGGAKIDATGVALFQGKGGVVPMTDVIIDGIEITGAGLNEASAGGTGGIRNGNVANMVVRNCYIHDNQDGIGPSVTSTLLVENCIFTNNALGGGQTHNIYTQAITATFNNVTSTTPPQSASPLRVSGLQNGGHALKSRANVTTINGGYYYSADASSIDIPDGSTQPCVITGATLEKKAGDGNHNILGYAVESMNNGVAGVHFVGCHFINNCASPQFISVNGGSLSFDATCTFEGTKPVAVGFSSVTGLPA